MIYPEGGYPGTLLRQNGTGINNIRVQLIPIRPAPKVKITGPEDVSRLVREMEDYDRESAKIIHVDIQNQVLGVENISTGSLSASIVHPRETVTGAILNKAASVLFVHNHPSGVCTPSPEDEIMHGTLTDAFKLVGIRLLDSVIVGKGCYYSIVEGGGKKLPAAPGPQVYKYSRSDTRATVFMGKSFIRDLELERTVERNRLLEYPAEWYLLPPEEKRRRYGADIPTAFKSGVDQRRYSWEDLTAVYGIPAEYVQAWKKVAS